MRKIVKMTHAFGTIKISPAGNGEDRDTVDARVNAKLAEGYDEVIVIPLRSQFNTDGAMTDVVNEYIFLQHEEDAVEAAAPVAKVAKTKKEKEAVG